MVFVLSSCDAKRKDDPDIVGKKCLWKHISTKSTNTITHELKRTAHEYTLCACNLKKTFQIKTRIPSTCKCTFKSSFTNLWMYSITKSRHIYLSEGIPDASKLRIHPDLSTAIVGPFDKFHNSLPFCMYNRIRNPHLQTFGYTSPMAPLCNADFKHFSGTMFTKIVPWNLPRFQLPWLQASSEC